MSWFSRFLVRPSMPATLRLAQEKRRLQRVAQEVGVSRAQAIKLASVYFKKPLKD